MGLGVIAFAFAILFSIAFHELGHLATAKAFGMKATQYFIGFGPRLWSFRRGETEYGVKAIPAGGYVKIVGMTDLEELEPEDESRAFFRQPAPQRSVVLVAGSAMHFVLAFVLTYVALAVVGVSTDNQTMTVAEVTKCINTDGTAKCTKADPPAPAYVAGVRKGDRIVSFGGTRYDDWREFTVAVRTAPRDRPIPLVVERDGRTVEVAVTPAPVRRGSIDDPRRRVTVGALGLSAELEVLRYGPVKSVVKTTTGMGEIFKQTGVALVRLPASIPKLARSAFGDAERDPGGAVSLLGAGNIAGQVAKDGLIGEFLVLIASINVFIGVFNLLPLLPLDGGHLAILGYEQARSRIARVLGRPDPGRVDLRKLLPVAYTFIVFLVALQALVLYADIAKPLANPFG